MNFRHPPLYGESVVAALRARLPHSPASATAIFRHGGSVGGTPTECRSRLLADGVWTPRGGWDGAAAYECGVSGAFLAQCLGLVESPGDPRARRRAISTAPQASTSPAIAPGPVKSAVGQVRGILAEQVIVSTALDPFPTLRSLVAYSGRAPQAVRLPQRSGASPVPLPRRRQDPRPPFRVRHVDRPLSSMRPGRRGRDCR
jgi:hypothetical protein